MAQQHREESAGRDGRSTNGHHGEHGRDEQSRRQFSEQDDERYTSPGYQGGSTSGRYETAGNPEERGTDRRFDRPRQDEWYGGEYGSDLPSRGETQWTREPRAQGMQGGFRRQESDWQAGYEQGQGPRGYGERGYNEGSRYPGQGSRGYGQGSGRMGQGSYGSGGRYPYEQEQYQPSQNQRYGSGYGRDDDGRYRSGQSGYGSQGAGGWSPGQSSSFGSSYEQPQRQSFRGKGPKGYERSDERLKEIICERLTDDDEIDASNITIEVRGGEVTLSGSVDDRRVKYQIEEVVERCGGVKDIHNNLRVSKEGRDSQEGRSEQAAKSSKQQRSSVVTPSSTGN